MKRGKPLKRTPMKRGPGPKRKTPLRGGGKLKPTGKRYARQKQTGEIDDEYREWIREQPCAVCGKRPRSQAAHARGKGAGWADWIRDRKTGELRGNLWPGCHDCHMQYDGQKGRGRATFMFEHAFDAVTTAYLLGRDFLKNRDGGVSRDGHEGG